MLRKAEIPFIPEDVKLDGSLEESVWQKATLLEGFHITGVSKNTPLSLAREQTTIKVFYNAEFLYLGITSYERQMDKINREVPGEGYPDAPLEWTGDIIEFFLQPKGSGNPFYHMAFNPNGATWDRSSSCGLAWNGKWEVAVTLREDRWESEVRILLSSLTSKEVFAGTPNPGEEWRVNFCRVAKPSGQFSTWSHTPGRFDNTDAFGSMVFKGTEKEDVLVDKVDPGSFSPGKNVFRAYVTNPSSRRLSIESVLELTLPEEGTVKETTRLAAKTFLLKSSQKTIIELPYHIKNEGEHRISLLLNNTDTKKIFYSGSVDFGVYPVREKLSEIEKFIDVALKEINASGTETESHPLLDEILKSLQKLQKKTEEIAAEMKKGGIDQFLIERTQNLNKDAERLKLSFCNRVKPLIWLKKSGKIDMNFATGVESTGNKIFRDEPFTGVLTDELEISVAGNEYESKQIVLLPVGEKDKEKVRIGVNDLRSDSGVVFPASGIQIHHVGYIQIKESPVGTRGGYWPDPLYPQNTFELKSEMEVVLLTAYAPKTLKAGLYKGKVYFYGEKENILGSMNLKVEVYPFSLPELSNFMTDFWFSEHHTNSIYGKNLTHDFFRRCMEVAGRYRLANYPGFTTVSRELKIYLEDDGDLSFDFTGIDPYIQAAVDNGLTFINISFSNNLGALRRFFSEVKATVRKTGRPVNITVNQPDRLVQKYLTDFYRHVLDMGWFTSDRIYCNITDEPWSEEKRKQVEEYAGIVNGAVPGIKIYGAGTYPKGGYGGINVWAPQVRQYKEEDYSEDDEVWWYQCLYKVPYPTFSINRPGLELRTQFWICWKYNVTGFLYWSSIYWGTSDTYSKISQRDRKNFFVHPHWPVPFDGTDFPGDALFFYPAPEGLIPNIRAVNIRDGIDDWEYLYLLNSLFRQAKDKGIKIPELLEKEIELWLNIPADIVESPRKFTGDAEKIYRARKKVAQLIVKLKELF
jgi:hypothetical protein